MQHIFLGIFPPNLVGTLLPIIIFGIIGFLLPYFHRYLAFIVLPLFIGFCVFLVQDLKFYVDLVSAYMTVVYSAMTFAFIAILVGMRKSWSSYKSTLHPLK